MSQPLLEVAGLFLRLGATAFGGPAAHIAMLHDETVLRRRWLSEQEFLDLLGATNLIPGPNSTELAIHLGHRRAGWPGLVVGGVCFILPAMLIVMALAWLHMRYGHTPTAHWLLHGVKPVMIAVILQALWNLGSKALRRPLPMALALAVIILYLLGVNELLLLFGGGLLLWLIRAGHSRRSGLQALAMASPLQSFSGVDPTAFAIQLFSLPVLFLSFLKIGAVLYGSGYVLLAFLRAEFVIRLGWLSDAQLLDAVTIGQLTPGPVFTTATWIGYQLGGVPGALLATVGIFLPGFLFVALSGPLIPRLRESPQFSLLLDGVNVASLGLMAAVCLQLGRSAIVDPATAAIALISALLLIRARVNSTWLIAGGALAGLLLERFS
ncbi:MAG: chromate efflux transporter [Calditrichaeota bacterium]|nr:chromate efflux transporter [Calditrichota bacterium]MCB9473158.1 chromate efflux transporter [Candidatus Delongbacteria bacterium]